MGIIGIVRPTKSLNTGAPASVDGEIANFGHTPGGSKYPMFETLVPKTIQEWF